MRMTETEWARAEHLLILHWSTGLLMTEEEKDLLVRAGLSRKRDWAESRPGRYRDSRIYPSDVGTWGDVHELDEDSRPGVPEWDTQFLLTGVPPKMI